MIILTRLATISVIGKLPAAGTFGSLVAVMTGGIIAVNFGFLALAGALVLFTLLAFPAINAHYKSTGKHDAREIIIDEVIGQWIAILAIPPPFIWDGRYISALAAAFILFRFFDILKPPPISHAESLPGAAGVIADDVLAGGVSGLIIILFFQFYGG